MLEVDEQLGFQKGGPHYASKKEAASYYDLQFGLKIGVTWPHHQDLRKNSTILVIFPFVIADF